MRAIEMKAIGLVRSTRAEPRDDGWDAERATIVLHDDVPAEALAGLDAFSHVEVFFYFHQVPDDKIEVVARRPRNNPAWPAVGIFAQRGKNRPNRLGATVCRVERVEGRELHVRGLDAVDGTPVLDLKPWMREFGPRGEVEQPSWATELMSRYWQG
jgi:tRNA (adenine37-N6)-methyltransferase